MATSEASCTNSSFSWSFNSLNQSPCLIAAYLGGACRGGLFDVGPLQPGRVYLGPSKDQANQCWCSGVFYNLVSACAGCQGEQWLKWSEFNTNCSTVYPSIFVPDIPQGTRVPHYAYLDPTADGDDFVASDATQISVLAAPESTPIPQSTGTSPNSEPTSGISSSKAGPIAGGVVGGIVGLALIVALVFWWTRRRSLRIAPSKDLNYAPVAATSPPPMSYTSAPSSFSATMPSQRLYDPSDPSTFPAPVQAPTTNYTGSSQALHTHVTGSTYPGSTAPGRYTGAPEV